MTSGFFRLNTTDFVKGLIVAVFGGVIALISASIEVGSLDFDWALIGKTALLSALAYLTKNLFTNSNDEPLTKERK